MAELAGRQHGVVTHGQLLALGVGRGSIQRRWEAGRLHRLYRGVYAVGHRDIGQSGRWIAAVFASGPGAVLSHHAGGALWGLRPTGRAVVDVTSPARAGHRTAGVVRHNGRLHPDDRTSRDGIPVTSVPRTLLDLAGVLQPHQLGRAIEAAERQRLFDLAAIERLIERSRGRRGSRLLAEVLRDYNEPSATRSDVEGIFFALCRGAGLSPLMNALVEGMEVDALFVAARVIVEIDSRGFHGTAAAFERDRLRDAKLMLAGYRVLRITYRQLVDDPQAVVQTVRALLDRG